MNVEIRPVREQENEIIATALIYIDCWKNDYAGLIPESVLSNFDLENEVKECREWLQSDGCNRIFAAFGDQQIIGYTAVAANHNDESELAEYDAELTGFFVQKEFRNCGIGLMLLHYTAEQLKLNGHSSFLVYNFKLSQSNSYYKGLGGASLLQVTQYSDGKALDAEVFGFQIEDLLAALENKLQKYSQKTI